MESKSIPTQIPSRKWYLIPALLFLLGPLLSAYLLYSTVHSVKQHTINFVIPGNNVIYIPDIGEYSLWIDTKGKINEQQLANQIKQITVFFKNLERGDSLLFRPKIGWQYTKPLGSSYTHYTLGTLKFNQAGAYQVTASSMVPATYHVYLHQPSFFKIVRTLIFAILLTIVTLVGSVLFAIIILIKRITGRNKMENNELKDKQPESKPESALPPSMPSSQAVTWAMVCHLSGFAGFIFPLANIIAPLLIWGFKRQEYPYLDDQGKEAINFQISITLYYLVSAILILIVIGLFLLPLLAAFQIIAMIIASIEAANGKLFRYPLTIRFLR